MKKSKCLMRRVFSSGLITLNTLVIVMLPIASYSESNPIDLTGTWKLSVGIFSIDSFNNCTVLIPTGGAGAVKDAPIAISKSGSGYSITVNAPATIFVSGHQMIFVEHSGNTTFKWVGRISQEVGRLRRKTVTMIRGTETCNNQVTLPFTFIKED